MNEPLRQLTRAGYDLFISDVVEADDKRLTAYGTVKLISLLRSDDRFKEGIFHKLHPNVGKPRTEFRSHTNELGPGSLQIVINKKTLYMECDVDQFGPYTDLVGIVGHLGKEVLWPKVKGWFS